MPTPDNSKMKSDEESEESEESFTNECFRLKPRRYCGTSNLLKNDLHFVDKKTVASLSGRVIVFNNLFTKKQHFINLFEALTEIHMMIMAPDRKHIALAEKAYNKPFISVYNIEQGKRVQVLRAPRSTISVKQYTTITFTCKSDTIVAVAGDPDWKVLFYNIHTGTLSSVINKIGKKRKRPKVTQICCHPNDPTQMILLGNDYYQMFRCVDNEWSSYGFSGMPNVIITGTCWVSVVTTLLGTKDGRLLFLENGHVQCVYKACNISSINIATEELDNALLQDTVDTKGSDLSIDEEVRALIGFEQGFAYSCNLGEVMLFLRLSESEQNKKWAKRGVYRVCGPPVGVIDIKLIDVIQHICISPDENVIACTTLREEIFFGVIQEDFHWKQITEVNFRKLFGDIHQGPIATVSVAQWKCIFLTAGIVDRTVIVWDFKALDKLFRREFQDDIHSASIHPTGMFCLLGFTDRIRLCVVFVNNLRFIRHVAIRACSLLEFSSGGHLFAALNDVYIQVYSSITLKCLCIFKGHVEPARCIRFSSDDYFIFSSGLEGSVFKWAVKKGVRSFDYFTRRNVTCGIEFVESEDMCYLVGTDGFLRELVHGELNRTFDLALGSLYTIRLSTCGRKMFAAGEEGIIVSLPNPIYTPITYIEYAMHTAPVKKVLMTHDDNLLMSISDDGSTCFWDILPPGSDESSSSSAGISEDEDENFDLDEVEDDGKYLTHVIIDLVDWNYKKKYMLELESRIVELEKENEFILWQALSAFDRLVKITQSEFAQGVAKLEVQLNAIDRSTVTQLGEWTAMIANIEEEEQELEVAVALRSDKLFKGSKSFMEKYNMKILHVIDSTLNGFKEFSKLKNRDLINKLKEHNMLNSEIEKLEKVNIENTQKKEDETDKEICQLKKNYDAKVAEEESINTSLRSENEFLAKQCMKMNRTILKCHFRLLSLVKQKRQMQKSANKKEMVANQLRNEIAVRDEQVRRNNNALRYAISLQNSYNKHKIVMNRKVKEVQSLVDPLKLICRQTIERYNKLESRFNAKNCIILRRKKRFKQKKKLYRQIRKAMTLSWKRSEAVFRVLRKIENEINTHAAAINEPKSFNKLLSKISNQFDRKVNNLEATREIQKVNEIRRQREYLEEMVDNLKGSVKRHALQKFIFKRTATRRIAREVKNHLEEVNAHIVCSYREKKKLLSTQKAHQQSELISTTLTVHERFNQTVKPTRSHVVMKALEILNKFGTIEEETKRGMKSLQHK
ncbi:cilia- and flagella-associated protein 57-like [Cimex lectularius]|uniref:WD repeat-containing protein 55 homolog n=1 Tax=Cimex lectularius TaxID=79782 RepID=A0A8I6RT74_CIMLE|nr:cilia- and flagella-associated protein 57-like [Cimex lectularius]